MKKIVAFVGSARKQHTQHAVELFLQHLQARGEIDYEIVRLSEQNLQVCRGCKLCLDRGDELCNLKDDRDLLTGKMLDADGVVFATPNYSFQVSALMKIFLDRLGYVFHRPRFFGRVFTPIVVQGVYGGPKILKYLDFVGSGLGFSTVKGSCITSLEPLTDKQRQKTDALLRAQAQRFYNRLTRPGYDRPTLLKLMIFRMSRTSLRLILDDTYADYRYYRDQGWFTSPYFYPIRLNPLQRLLGWIFDVMAARSARKR